MLRGGPFAERRVIDLLNRRYVCFFYNVGEGDHGYDADAEAWFKKHKQPHVYSGVFSRDGKRLAELPNDGDKHAYFDALRKVLDGNAAQDKFTEDEQKILDAGSKDDASKQAAARLHEELGKYEEALKLYTALPGADALLARARIARYLKKWKEAAPLLDKLAEQKAVPAEVAVERGYALLDGKKYDEARKLLVEAAKAHPKSGVIGELHYYAGIASWKLGRKEWAHFHWYHIIETLPNDRHYQRAWLSVAIKAIPFPFAELPGERGGGMVTHDSANKARVNAKADYDRLKDKFAEADYWTSEEKAPPKTAPKKDAEEEEEFQGREGTVPEVRDCLP